MQKTKSCFYLSPKPVEVELDGSSWYQLEDILDHRGKSGPMCECLVRWKDFDDPLICLVLFEGSLRTKNIVL